ncbi:TGFBRIb [Oopsacas minuta]|uniref:receptor protein serine/threonine kinase n=2 Tax=Oopsacas minuta TaxID=111878 RepID=A0AAV7JZ97_9METZ|nr:TGFBRIb [Oopsacas minuta]
MSSIAATTSNSTELTCIRKISNTQDTCTVTYNKDIHPTPPRCLVVEDYETDSAFNARIPDRFEQGCVGGDTGDSSEFHCDTPNQRIRIYNQRKYVEYTYCCSTDLCNSNTASIMPSIFPLSTQLITTPTLQGQGQWSTSIVQLVLPSILVPLVCTGVCISLLIAVCMSFRGKHRYRKSIRGSQHPFFDTHTRVSGTIDTDVYPLSTMTYGECTVSSSATGIPLLEQRTISRHISVTRILGQGRYGTVYEGSWRGNKVAVKIFFSHNEDSWKHEADIYRTCMLRHSNILGFIAADMKDDNESIQLWLVTDLHPNGSLYSYLNHRQLEHIEALKLARTLANGLAFLHEDVKAKDAYKPAIAHRDIKSRNILVKLDGECCIGDLGMAIREGFQSDFKIAEPTQGTRRYMSPEALTGSLDLRQIDSLKQSDVYSMGLVLWEIGLRWKSCTKLECEKPQLPYEDNFPSDPSLDEMYEFVVVQNNRPYIPDRWAETNSLAKLLPTLRECWYRDPMARLTAHKVENILSNFD